MTATGPTKAATEAFEDTLEGARRLTGLQVHTLANAVVDVDDVVGYARLTELGTSSVVTAQTTAKRAVEGLLDAQMAAAAPGLGPVQVPTQVGVWGSGQPVRDMFARTQTVARNRMRGGATFPEARAASADVLTRMAATEPHRIGRDGQLDAGLADERFDRFRRVVEPRACDFCRMLATRGAVYLTAEAAGKGKKYHDTCRCHVVLIISEVTKKRSKKLSSDWRNAIRDDELMKKYGAMKDRTPKPKPQPKPVVPEPVVVKPPVVPEPVVVQPRILDQFYRPPVNQARVQQLEADLASARENVAMIEESLNGYQEGLKAIRAAIKADPNIPAAHKTAAGMRQTSYEYRKWESDVDYAKSRLATTRKGIKTYESKLAEASGDLPSDIADWELGEAMRPNQAASKGANPLYYTNKKATVNCGRCVQSYELRRRGIAVSAKPMEAMQGTPFDIIEGAWADPITGKPRRMRLSLSEQEFHAEVQSWPPGSRGFAYGGWKGGSAHIWNVEKLPNGQVMFSEAQNHTGLFDPKEYLKLIKPGKLGAMRVDDLLPTGKIADVVVKEGTL